MLPDAEQIHDYGFVRTNETMHCFYRRNGAGNRADHHQGAMQTKKINYLEEDI